MDLYNKNELKLSKNSPEYRKFIVDYIKKNNVDISNMDIYEFGIYAGRSIRDVYVLLRLNNLKPRKILGFDSFMGLPESEGIYWKKDELDARRFFKTNDIEEVKKRILSIIPDNEIKIELIDGLFKDSLNENLLEKLDVACWVNIDADIYISAYQALDYIFKYNLVKPNTIISYDDWGGTDEFKGGESKAHKEISEKYSVQFELLKSFGISPHIQKVFIIKKIG